MHLGLDLHEGGSIYLGLGGWAGLEDRKDDPGQK